MHRPKTTYEWMCVRVCMDICVCVAKGCSSEKGLLVEFVALVSGILIAQKCFKMYRPVFCTWKSHLFVYTRSRYLPAGCNHCTQRDTHGSHDSLDTSKRDTTTRPSVRHDRNRNGGDTANVVVCRPV